MPAWLLRFDGLFEPRFTDRGIATFGFTLDRGAERMGSGKGLLLAPGHGASANAAEFGALLHALQWLIEQGGTGGEPLFVEGDSRLVIESVAGRWKLNSDALVELRDMARELASKVGGPVSYQKISREANAQPDALTREAYHEAAAAHPEWGLGIHSKSARR